MIPLMEDPGGGGVHDNPSGPVCCISDLDNKIVMSDMSKPTAVVTQDLIIYQLMIHIELMP